MNTTLILPFALSAALLSGAAAQLKIGAEGRNAKSAAEVGTLPEDRKEQAKRSRLESDERNPFASRTQSKVGPVAKAETEESRIRAVLEKFVVNGIAKASDGGYKAQLESIILEEGKLLPALIEGQLDQLQVTKVTPQIVQISWLGDEDAASPRQHTMAINMEPVVATMLPSPKAAAKRTMVIKDNGTPSAGSGSAGKMVIKSAGGG